MSAHLVELPPGEPFWRRFLPHKPLPATSIEEVRELTRLLARDPQVRGMLVHVPPLIAGWAACASLRECLLALRKAGKQVVCFLPEGGGSRELYVALGGDRICLGPLTAFSPLGLASGPFYMKQLLDRLGVEVQAQACGEYKSAAEPALRDDMSEPARRQLVELLGSLHGELARALCERPGFTAALAQAVLAKGLLTARAARECGLVDALRYEDELASELLPDGDPHRAFVDATRYLRFHRAKLWVPVRKPSYIAVVPVRGTIVSEPFGPMPGGAVLATVVAGLRELAKDAAARAVVLYVNSPGGSALASELIHREVQRLARQKPVVAYFADVAASGGYYIAAPCQRIVAEAVTVTGSIGVISVKVAINGLLDKLGVTPQVVQTAAHADMFSVARKLTDDEQGMLQAHADELYARFLEVVAEGRGRTREEVDAVARGRVWSGRAAQEHGLVDVLGGFDRALDEARALVPDLSVEARARLLPHVHSVKSRKPLRAEPMQGPADALVALLANLPDGALFAAAIQRHEPTLYYAAGLSDLS